jgi:K+-transporting ATPase ATPase C chain
MKSGLAELKTSCLAVLALAVILCGFYPLASWILAQGLFPARANGSLVVRDGVVMGSSLIGRNFSGPEYFHPRPSEAGRGYDADRSGGSNLGPLSKELVGRIRERSAAYRAENGLPADGLVPADAVTASASGLDPHISLKNALLQTPRVARARGLSDAEVLRQVKAFSEGRTLGFLGDPRVNVLLLNLALDGVRRAG